MHEAPGMPQGEQERKRFGPGASTMSAGQQERKRFGRGSMNRQEEELARFSSGNSTMPLGEQERKRFGSGHLSEKQRQSIYAYIVEHGKTVGSLDDFKNYIEEQGSWLPKEQKDALYNWWNELNSKTQWWEYILGLSPLFLVGCSYPPPEAPELKPISPETETMTEAETELLTEKQKFRLTEAMLKKYGWKGDYDINHINKVLEEYGITDEKSIRLFFATCGHESGKGEFALERLNLDGSTAGVYEAIERGAGYIQLTGKDLHLLFLETVNNPYNGGDTATYIAENYPWEAAAWYWSSADARSLTDDSLSLNEYVVKFNNDSESMFLVTQFFVNVWPRYYNEEKGEIEDRQMPNNYATDIRDGRADWSIEGNILTVYGEKFVAPSGWYIPDTGRRDSYYSVMNIFK